MRVVFSPLFSGSNGNAIFLQAGETSLLVDAGVSGSRISRALDKLNVNPERLDGLLITHEHADHICGAGILSRRYHLPVYATEGTWLAMAEKLGRIDPANRRVVQPGQDFYIGRVNVTPFSIPHDAAQPVGYAFVCSGLKVSIATDLGHVSEKWMREVEGSDLLLLESNHDVEMLKAGRYPYELKRRILGAHGHLSNDAAADAAVELAGRGVRHIVLGHLSGENNFPELALQTAAMAFEQAGIEIGLDVARRDATGDVYCLETQEAAHAAQ